MELYDALVGVGLFPRPPGRLLTVLIVDDEPKAVEIIALRVTGMAGNVLRAYGGREAIEIARRELPDVIVLDLMMPAVSGFEVVAALNERPETADIPVLVVTAKQITADDRLRLTRSVATIMDKAGFDTHMFRSEVRRALAGRRRVA
jgi:CheY-like chemotaxis protein